jgi:hypothetical protein
MTATLQGAKDSLRMAARAAVLHQVAVKPFICPNGKPLVTCLWNVCENKCSEKQVCLPDYCGHCGAK